MTPSLQFPERVPVFHRESPDFGSKHKDEDQVSKGRVVGGLEPEGQDPHESPLRLYTGPL